MLVPPTNQANTSRTTPASPSHTPTPSFPFVPRPPPLLPGVPPVPQVPYRLPVVQLHHLHLHLPPVLGGVDGLPNGHEPPAGVHQVLDEGERVAPAGEPGLVVHREHCHLAAADQF